LLGIQRPLGAVLGNEPDLGIEGEREEGRRGRHSGYVYIYMSDGTKEDHILILICRTNLLMFGIVLLSFMSSKRNQFYPPPPIFTPTTG
jgi:hypothetical protein